MALVAGRTAFLTSAAEAVAEAQRTGSRLALALVVDEQVLTPESTASLCLVAGAQVYVVGSRSAALVLPGLGRAGAFGVLARIQVECGLEGRAVELEPDESATELVARLLTPSVGLQSDT